METQEETGSSAEMQQFEAEVAAHDAKLAERGLDIWVGSEPTFTDRWQNTPEWLSAALGEGKEALACELVRVFQAHFPGCLVLRSQGRLYPGEDHPRWCYGVMRRRDGRPLWSGPPDPIAAGDADTLPSEPDACDAPEGSIPEGGEDELRPDPVPTIVLPDFGSDVAAFLTALREAEARAREQGWTRLVFTGALPPWDATLALTTVTPDPAVIEVNAAPSFSAVDFLQRSSLIYAAADRVGLSPYRLHFNGAVADSGGGGQITLGGPSPESSPFVRDPRLLPRLVRFFNRHPALSYLFSHDFVGVGGQSVRSDERGTDALDELRLALALVERGPLPTAEGVWQALAPFLSDAAGNSHRAEINVEKLCCPFGGQRGRQGLVEFRALRMQHSPERATAIACLLRAIVALLALHPDDAPLIDWGRELHDRFALPFHLQQDLEQVLATLDDAGLGLGPMLTDRLRQDEFRHQADVDLPGATLEVWGALEFWPLLGDAASPAQGGTSRLIDASTARVELRLRPREPDGVHWRITAAGRPLPMRDERDRLGPLRVGGLRYRAFVPRLGLHPSLPSQAPVVLQLSRPDRTDGLQVTLHDWRPDGEAYPGLPQDRSDAAARRRERVTCVPCEAPVGPGGDARADGAPDAAHVLDLRWVATDP